jgi:hypothetical protein
MGNQLRLHTKVGQKSNNWYKNVMSTWKNYLMLQETFLNVVVGLTTKARACKVVDQEGSLGVTSHAPRSVGKCEGMNPHTPKGASTLGVGVLADSQIFKK